MKTKTNFRARVMKYAWQILRATGQAWRQCMLKAWELYRLLKALRSGIVSFEYKKMDGSVRMATGTLRDIPIDATFGGKRVTKQPYRTMTYFDTAKNAFRSFRVENLLRMA